jgi:hypothetical protein
MPDDFILICICRFDLESFAIPQRYDSAVRRLTSTARMKAGTVERDPILNAGEEDCFALKAMIIL